ncbi:hypothetical protein [Clostridium sp.]|uniref:hypothetical protein n=1 Tax=Clostridium sp. TaxID=1506 RepID=UPI00290EABE4|nr:hypothetical protein [Clostridium sp.]MBS7132255.1 hypothetical protein [Clostridium sp.]MDU6047123.1 hypothetical protein [Clostridium sp.]MDU6220579.1 hypothetical protein [Clostridium sp.]MDU6270938.1 hypothetical protein [Clostridium sp.]MDU6326434.1 hypothetical protein [Clostridium sp.]
MLVNEIKTYKVIICGQEVELKLDFNALIKMHKEYGNAFLLVYDYVFQSDLEKLPQIVRCMANKEFTEEEIKSNMLINISSIETLGNITLDLLNQELTNTSEFKKEVKKNHNPSTEEKKK